MFDLHLNLINGEDKLSCFRLLFMFFWILIWDPSICLTNRDTLKVHNSCMHPREDETQKKALKSRVSVCGLSPI